jgi:hypothetical protein
VIKLSAPLEIWSGADGRSHYLTIPDEESGEIRAHAMMVRRGFGSVRVEARIGAIVWRTSVFPMKAGGYFLPVKMEVCRAAGLTVGGTVEVELELL